MKEYIGEVYVIKPRDILRYGFQSHTFDKFTKDDISDQINDNIKIFNTWYSKSDIVLYDSIYDTKRNAIRKRHTKENK